ncbi:hypothetical protein [Methylobacterium sp. NEAU K]|uniref:hypothetical protein n=1 Tax=Methylobacterium sp. NEAU K TaxID=3064946 RepID=UPI002732D07B|nr:hypothetical protein [Methylobacterium sp. NEAU K]MDP4006471.1 hypothetical protein [Methylobacterium sp. NEAU K]
MRRTVRIAFGAALLVASTSLRAQNLGVEASEFGARATAASARIGDHVDWGQPECGEPKYLAGTCVWKLGMDFSLTTNVLDRGTNAGLAITRWQRFDLKDVSRRKVFDQTCRALVGALRPGWPAAKVVKFTLALIGSGRKDHEVTEGDVTFAFYTYPETIICQAQPTT